MTGLPLRMGKSTRVCRLINYRKKRLEKGLYKTYAATSKATNEKTAFEKRLAELEEVKKPYCEEVDALVNEISEAKKLIN